MNIQGDMIRYNNKSMASALKSSGQDTVMIRLDDTAVPGKVVSVDGITVTIQADPIIVKRIIDMQKAHQFVSMGIKGCYRR